MQLHVNRRLLAWLLVFMGVELIGIYLVSKWLGGWTAVLLLIGVGLAGAYLSLAEGRKVWNEAQKQMQLGQIPGQALIDGICVALGGLLLLLPGFISDIAGLTLLLPLTRRYYRLFLLQWIERLMRGGNFRIGRF
jgi:UPF0716 protein FxsA